MNINLIAFDAEIPPHAKLDESSPCPTISMLIFINIPRLLANDDEAESVNEKRVSAWQFRKVMQRIGKYTSYDEVTSLLIELQKRIGTFTYVIAGKP